MPINRSEEEALGPVIQDLVNSGVDRDTVRGWDRKFILQQTLGKLLQSLPSNGRLFGTAGELFGDGGPMAIPETQARRVVSEHKEMVTAKLQRLLEHSPATQSYKQEVMRRYAELYVQGLQTTFPWAQEELVDFFTVAGWSEEQIGTMFDKGEKCRARELTAYHLTCRNLRDLVEREYKKQENTEETRKALQEQLEAWRKDYCLHYGVELSVEAPFEQVAMQTAQKLGFIESDAMRDLRSNITPAQSLDDIQFAIDRYRAQAEDFVAQREDLQTSIGLFVAMAAVHYKVGFREESRNLLTDIRVEAMHLNNPEVTDALLKLRKEYPWQEYPLIPPPEET